MQKSLMQQGFESLVSPKEQFAKEQKFGEKILFLAWGVEIFAVLLGLSISGLRAYAGYVDNNDDSLNALITALVGGLPFVAIAIVELAKIPLAAGLYKVKVPGWRLLILGALLSLTYVTAETMYMGLETNFTNTTVNIKRQLNKIKGYQDDLDRMDSTYSSAMAAKKSIEETRDKEVELHESTIKGLESQLRLANSKEGNEKSTNEIAQYQGEVNGFTESILNERAHFDKLIEDLRKRNSEIPDEISRVTKQYSEQIKGHQETKAQRIQENNKNRAADIEDAKVFGFINEEKKKEIDARYDEIERQIIGEIDPILSPLQKAQEDSIKALGDEKERNIQKIKSLEKKKEAAITDLERKRDDKQTKLDNLVNETTKRSDGELKDLREQINTAKKNKQEAMYKANELSAVEDEKIAADANAKSDGGKSEKLAIQDKQNQARAVARELAEKDFVHRIAFSWFGTKDNSDDILQAKNINLVKNLWFGSIAVIVAVTGSVLALISYILRDPEAFVERKSSSLGRRISRLSYVLTGRVIKIAGALAELIKSVAGSLLAVAQIFKGAIGKPLQRSLRSTLFAIRKRMKEPKIVEVIKEVEVVKVVEKEVPVEVEKIVEKEVIKEVPVDKIVLKEVPKEVIRKELIYVPLYSTDSGLIDSKKSALGSKLFSGEVNETKLKDDSESSDGK